jgi:hypothetical protein
MPSLLPETIIPITEPVGTVSGQPVYMTKNWWLLLYNIVINSIGTGPNGSIIEQESVSFATSQASIATSDVPALAAQVRALQIQQGHDAITSSDVPGLAVRISGLEMQQRPPDVVPSPQSVRDAQLLGYLALTGSSV